MAFLLRCLIHKYNIMKETITNLTKKLHSQKVELLKTRRSLAQVSNTQVRQSNEYYANDLDLILANYYKKLELSDKIEKLESNVKTYTEELLNLFILLGIEAGKTIYTSEQDNSGNTIRVW